MSSAPGAATPAVAPWESPAALPPLGDDDIHVWRADRGAFARHHAACLACLAPDERARQARFHFERDRDRFAVAHAVKRLLLAHYAACRPDDVAFVTGAHGKPSLAGAAHAIEFNMTDTSDLSLIAVTRARAVGVDAEAFDPGMDDEERALTAESAFSASERAVVTGDPPADRARRFFTTWSRKEAYIKATGDGIVPGLDHFDVSSAADDARLLADRRTPGATERWAMCALDLGPDVAGAVVWDRLVSPPIRIVRCLVATPATLGLPGT